jgi:hypothetical protein
MFHQVMPTSSSATLQVVRRALLAFVLVAAVLVALAGQSFAEAQNGSPRHAAAVHGTADTSRP